MRGASTVMPPSVPYEQSGYSRPYPGYSQGGHPGDPGFARPRHAPDRQAWAPPPEQPRWDQPPRARPGWDQPAAEDGPEAHDPAVVELRNQVVDRLRVMNAKHAQQAWDRRHGDPIGPHALALFYAAPTITTGGRPGYQLATATRLFLAGSDVDDLPRLLYRLAGIAAALARTDAFDPRVQMADRSEPMPHAARYIGLGVSSLDTEAGTWAQVRQEADGIIDIPGRSFAYLADGTFLQVDRRASRDFGAVSITSSRDLNTVPGMPSRMWRWADSHYDAQQHRWVLTFPDHAATADIWHWLIQLHHTIYGGQR
jgi:hypothetical protein